MSRSTLGSKRHTDEMDEIANLDRLKAGGQQNLAIDIVVHASQRWTETNLSARSSSSLFV